jgi:hypothetical protein
MIFQDGRDIKSRKKTQRSKERVKRTKVPMTGNSFFIGYYWKGVFFNCLGFGCGWVLGCFC